MLAPKILVAAALALLVSADDANNQLVTDLDNGFDMNILREIHGDDDVDLSNRFGSDTKQDLWFTGAILDHKNPSAGNWSQRYHYNDEWYGGPGSPVFLYINGEWEAKAQTVASSRSTMNDLAKKHKAMVVAVEHRYYGDSIPNGDRSKAAMQKYLSSDAALADLATFHAFFTEKHNLQGAAWIAWGYSYAGMLSSWFKLKYPSLVAGAVASSAPVQAQVDMKEYLEGVTRGLKHYGGQECVDNVKSAMDSLHALVEADSDELYDSFGICSKLSTQRNKYRFEWMMAHEFKAMAQYKVHNGRSLATACTVLKNPSFGATPLDRLSKLYMTAAKACPTKSPKPTPAPSTKKPSPTTDDDRPIWGRQLKQAADNQFGQWGYQTCNEFGFLQTATTGVSSPFRGLGFLTPENVLASSTCAAFGINAAKLQANVDATNAKNGGWDIDVENVIFTNGAIDPWAGLSVTKQPKNPKSKYIVIEGATHCEDTYLANGDGPMKDAIKVIGDAVAEFLADAAKTPAPTPAPTTKLTPVPTMMPVTTAPTPDSMCPPMEMDTDYYGNDIAAIRRASADSCCADCKATPGCKLYVWNLHNGGTCWLKSKKGARTTYYGAKAGVIDAPANDNCPPMEHNTDYYGNDIASVPRKSADDCCADCRKTPGCKVYVWNLHNGGTCWLKSKKGTRSTYHGAMVGVVDAAPTTCAIEANIDYYGNDVAAIPRASSDDCCGDCHATAGCSVWVWNRHNGGTCWLKSKKGNRSVYHGAIAGSIQA
ncbi:hypothetical protein SPRG_20580 [Saprolegnia parasitica CBS 223.65]|uniref:Apple domain-containing protein n=1 Tax=Saprolegnia parasitica (strain CBS 223.65) TaxID=695850 RepID=A0A067C8G3_SAPPC|nr:hypothetical protein SPRG_20580 [Saprolegnia parasitica CBS 223.65]KDO26778.1 hypothetical protein SPRG_20580 [Saprolegnia parasitica CBS 223.65]|eukprot:XP_012202528.1 hypothetical protein SPRG_20580 [Saprolegnia parasitica CBS 223.65]